VGECSRCGYCGAFVAYIVVGMLPVLVTLTENGVGTIAHRDVCRPHDWEGRGS
jgi:hypothetical protein